MGRKAFDNSIDYKEIGTRIRITRLKLAVSQTECASKLGISQTHLSNIEHGRSGITLQMLCRVCDILQVSLDYLVRGAEKTDEKKHSEITIDEVVRVIKMLKGIEEK